MVLLCQTSVFRLLEMQNIISLMTQENSLFLGDREMVLKEVGLASLT